MTFVHQIDGSVQVVRAQPDGKILVGGYFSSPHQGLARLNSYGSVDASLNASVANNGVTAIAVQSDGKLIIGGDFHSVNGGTVDYLARLDATGNLDTTFTNSVISGYAIIHDVAIQSDGKILVIGYFSVEGSPRGIVRLNPNGSRDTSFNPPSNFNTTIALAIQGDGKILIGGGFKVTGANSQTNMARLLSNGSLDLSFNPPKVWSGVFTDQNYINAISIQQDANILIGGIFTAIGGVSRGGLARILASDPAISSSPVGQTVLVGTNITFLSWPLGRRH